MDSVVLEMLVEWPDAHCPDSLGDQVADWVIGHRGDDAGFEIEAIGEIGRHIELAAGNMDIAMSCLAEGDNARVKSMHQSPERQKIQSAVWADVQNLFHVVVKMVPRVGVEPTTN